MKNSGLDCVTELSRYVADIASEQKRVENEFRNALRNPDTKNLDEAIKGKREQDKKDALELAMIQNMNLCRQISIVLEKYSQSQIELKKKEEQGRTLKNAVISLGGAIIGAIVTGLLELLL